METARGGTVLVTGGTGTLGRLVVPRLLAAGCDVRVVSRQPQASDDITFMTGDLSTGEGIQAAIDGAETVLHLAGSAKGDANKARHLTEAVARADVRHLVYISVVGADRVPVERGVDRALFGYFGEKRAAELAVAEAGVPWTTLRATQFHDLMLTTVRQMAKLPVVPVPARVRFQPIEADEVAARLVELTLGTPAGLVPDIGGPMAYEMAELVRGYLRARGKRRPIVPVRLPGRAARAVRDGANLALDRAVGQRTWEDFLAAQLR